MTSEKDKKVSRILEDIADGVDSIKEIVDDILDELKHGEYSLRNGNGYDLDLDYGPQE